MNDSATVSISYEDKILVATGSLITFGPEEMLLDVEYHGDRLKIFLLFQDSTDAKTNRLHADPIPPDGVRLTIRTPLRSLGAFFAIDIGYIADRALWCNLRVSPLGDTPSKHVVYSLYVSGEAEHG